MSFLSTFTAVCLCLVCKSVFSVNRVADIVPVLRKAIQIAQSGTPGNRNIF